MMEPGGPLDTDPFHAWLTLLTALAASWEAPDAEQAARDTLMYYAMEIPNRHTAARMLLHLRNEIAHQYD